MLSGALYKATPVHPALKESVRSLLKCDCRCLTLIDDSSKGHEAVANDGVQVTCTAFSPEQELVWAGVTLVSSAAHLVYALRSQMPVLRHLLCYDSARALNSANAAAGINLGPPTRRECLEAARRVLSHAGTANGGLFALQCPDLQNYSHARAHKQPTLDVVALGEGAVSASADWIRYHSTGSVPRLTVTAEEVHQTPHILMLDP